MRHIRLTLQYDGSDYSGWQVQKKGKTIQGIIEDAIYSVSGERTRLTGASRTDAGVHALEQVAVFKTQSKLEPQILKRALNANLPQDVRIIDAGECSSDFHPRYSAKNKTYSYIISFPGAYSVFLGRYSWQMPYQLSRSVGIMRESALCLIGKHDFSSFRASGCNSKSQVRTINNIEISDYSSIDFMSLRFNAPIIKISIQADAFLRHMARNIVGTLVEVGRGRISPDKVKEILDSKDRRSSGPTAPAQGLFLEKIEY
ncbi:MAG: tRNA pseudouridine(38-40) synthase TruA [Thermodesulfovibrionia bacterium]